MNQPEYDLFIIGGGVNGCGIAADAALRGLKVGLCEQKDLASGTSSASSKLIHGGLRYLEYYEFGLVRKALIEREVLLKNAPHIIWPLTFILPHAKHLRPRWLLRLGLFLYDHLGGRKILPASKSINFDKLRAQHPLQEKYQQGFSYADCWVDDARLVTLNALLAKNHRADIYTYHRVTQANANNNGWDITCISEDGEQQQFRAKVLVNAGGPWIDQINRQVTHYQTKNHVSLIKGSHIIVPRFYQGEQCYILQNTDQRIVFVIPYEQQFCLIGTTDVRFQGNPQDATIEQTEISYLCEIVSSYFQHQVTPSDVVASYSGVRALIQEESDNASKITRDYHLELDTKTACAPLLSIFGGKITTYRKLAEQAVDKLKPYFPHLPTSVTEHTPLPGGDIRDHDFNQFLSTMQQQFDWLPDAVCRRYARTYGTRMTTLLQNATALIDLGQHFGDGVYQREVDFVIAQEWVKQPDDFLQRRSKLYLHISKATRETIIQYILGQPKH